MVSGHANGPGAGRLFGAVRDRSPMFNMRGDSGKLRNATRRQGLVLLETSRENSLKLLRPIVEELSRSGFVESEIIDPVPDYLVFPLLKLQSMKVRLSLPVCISEWFLRRCDDLRKSGKRAIPLRRRIE
jgi:hypothetical protein